MESFSYCVALRPRGSASGMMLLAIAAILNDVIHQTDQEQILVRQNIGAIDDPASLTPAEPIDAREDLAFLDELVGCIEPTRFNELAEAGAHAQIPAAGEKAAAVAFADDFLDGQIDELKLAADPADF